MCATLFVTTGAHQRTTGLPRLPAGYTGALAHEPIGHVQIPRTWVRLPVLPPISTLGETSASLLIAITAILSLGPHRDVEIS
jgi:hypothetical protein